MRDHDDLFLALAKSRFRASFSLGPKEQEYFRKRGLQEILEHGRDFIAVRLAPAEPKNDGRQTPMGGHPIFIAQHATGTCCRRCLKKWHYIGSGRPLQTRQQEYILDVLAAWLGKQKLGPPQGTLPGFEANTEPL